MEDMAASDELPVSRADHDKLAAEVAALKSTVVLIEAGLKHQAEMNTINFKNITEAVTGLRGVLDPFMSRINGILSGEVQLPQSRQMLEDWSSWRKDVNKQLDEQAVLNGQVKLLGRIAVILVGSNALAIAAAVYSALT